MRIMAMLMLNHNLPRYMQQQQERVWRKHPACSIAGKTAVVIGTGSLGSEIANATKKIGVSPIGINRSGNSADGFKATYSVAVLDSCLALADYLFIACPLTKETEGMIDARRIALMKPGAGLINVGRSRVVDGLALQNALTMRVCETQ